MNCIYEAMGLYIHNEYKTLEENFELSMFEKRPVAFDLRDVESIDTIGRSPKMRDLATKVWTPNGEYRMIAVPFKQFLQEWRTFVETHERNNLLTNQQ
jgi:hypothetical protein